MIGSRLWNAVMHGRWRCARLCSALFGAAAIQAYALVLAVVAAGIGRNLGLRTNDDGAWDSMGISVGQLQVLQRALLADMVVVFALGLFMLVIAVVCWRTWRSLQSLFASISVLMGTCLLAMDSGIRIVVHPCREGAKSLWVCTSPTPEIGMALVFSGFVAGLLGIAFVVLLAWQRH